MKNNHFKNFGAIASFNLLLVAAAFAQTGDRGGNGGGTFVCLDTRDTVLSAQSQELWNLKYQAQELDSFTGDFSQVADQAITKLGKKNLRFRELVQKEKTNILGKMQLKDVRIRYQNDDRHVFENASCAEGRPEFMAGAVYFDNTGEVIFSESIWNKLSAVDRAALITHEAVYKVLRARYDSTTSDRAQAIVRAIFQKQTTGIDWEKVPAFCQISQDSSCTIKVEFLQKEVGSSTSEAHLSAYFYHKEVNKKGRLKTVLNARAPSEFVAKQDRWIATLLIDINAPSAAQPDSMQLGWAVDMGEDQFPFSAEMEIKIAEETISRRTYSQTSRRSYPLINQLKGALIDISSLVKYKN